jgi:hypothetical protein
MLARKNKNMQWHTVDIYKAKLDSHSLRESVMQGPIKGISFNNGNESTVGELRGHPIESPPPLEKIIDLLVNASDPQPPK